MNSGYYWCYTLDMHGNRLQHDGRPIIVEYDAQNHSLTFGGCEVSFQYDPERYQLIYEIPAFTPKEFP